MMMFFVLFIFGDLRGLEERIKRVEEKMVTREEFMLFVDMVNKRFEDMQKYMDKRFEDMNKRFEDMNKRFESMQGVMNVMFTVLGVLNGLVIIIISVLGWMIRKEIKKLEGMKIEVILEKVKQIVKSPEIWEEILKEPRTRKVFENLLK